MKNFNRQNLKNDRSTLYVWGENDVCYPIGEKWRKLSDKQREDLFDKLKKEITDHKANNMVPLSTDARCYQTTTQAVIRGEPNAAPIITTDKSSMSDSARQKLTTRDVNNILKELRSGKYKKLVFSDRLVGTGIAALNQGHNLSLWKHLLKELSRLKPTGGSTTDTGLVEFVSWFSDGKCKPAVRVRKSRKPRLHRVQPAAKESEPDDLSPIGASVGELEKAIRNCLLGTTDEDTITIESSSTPTVIDSEEEEEDETDESDLDF